MMDKCTASNGVTVEVQGISGKLRIFDDSVLPVTIDPVEADALREYFQAERDEELGRWRWPENPDYVVYARGDGWLVVSERSGNSKHYSHRDHASVGSSELTQAMRAYFEAHPERKPWEDAKPGELWELNVEGATRNYAAIASRDIQGDVIYLFPVNDIHAPKLGVRASVITGGRRIFPESD